MKVRCEFCGHEPCMACIGLTWQTLIPSNGPNVVCCLCRSNRSVFNTNGKNGRGENHDHFRARPRSKRFRYQPEICEQYLFEWSPDVEARMVKIAER